MTDFDQLSIDPGFPAAKERLSAKLKPIEEKLDDSRLDFSDWEGENCFEFDYSVSIKALFAEIGLCSADWLATATTSQLCIQDSTVISFADFNVLASFLDVADVETLIIKPLSGQTYSNNDLVDSLSRIALHPALTLPVAFHFRRTFIDIVARWILSLGWDGDRFNMAQDKALVYSIFDAFTRLLELHPGIYPLFQLFTKHPMLAAGPLAFLQSDIHNHDELFDHPNLMAYLLLLHRLLASAPHFPDIRELTSWSLPHPFVHACMSQHPVLAVRLVAWRVWRLWCGFSAQEGIDLLQQHVLQLSETTKDASILHLTPAIDERRAEFVPLSHALAGVCSIQQSTISVHIRPTEADAWILSFEELRRLNTFAQRIKNAPQSCQRSDMQVDGSDAHPGTDDLCALVGHFDGTLFVRDLEPSQVDDASFVETPANGRTIRQALRFLSARRPILLSSGPSAGKTTIIRQLYRQRFPKHPASNGIVILNLADRSVDAKSLLGTMTTDPQQPGTFKFVDGTIARCLREGKWLLLKDIHLAADDVHALISSISDRMCSRATQCVGGANGGLIGPGCVGVEVNGQFIAAAEGFALFATTSNEHRTSFLGHQYFSSIAVEQSDATSLHLIISRLFPRAWQAVGQAIIALLQADSPFKFSLRDVLKWSRRLNAKLSDDDVQMIANNMSLRESILLDAIDCFCARYEDSEASLVCIREIGQLLAVPTDHADWLSIERSPLLISTSSFGAQTTRIGRATIVSKYPQHRPNFAESKPVLRLLEALAIAVDHQEAVLLTGETGTGKTSTVSHLASLSGQRLVSLNLSVQTEASDLLGGYKPVSIDAIALYDGEQLLNKLADLLSGPFSLSKNADFLDAMRVLLNKKRWSRFTTAVREAAQTALKRLKKLNQTLVDGPNKRRRLQSDDNPSGKWQALLLANEDFAAKFALSKASRMAFTFVEGPLVKAMQEGSWILLDEVNLASAEMLQSLVAVLGSDNSSLVLTERGDLAPVQKHPNFRLFACMNPSSDIGKRDLPAFLRQHFTEIYVHSPDQDPQALQSIVLSYLSAHCHSDRKLIVDVAETYSKLKKLSLQRDIVDGTNQSPHYSMRNLCRALAFGAAQSSTYTVRRATYEGFVMTFTMLLDESSRTRALTAIQDSLYPNADKRKAALLQKPKPQLSRSLAYQLGPFTIKRGAAAVNESQSHYVLTPSVQSKLVDLARIISYGRYPVLLQGPTSSGKTSIIEYIAAQAGYKCIRINNHEHTDVQEYLGSYVSDAKAGQLKFADGLLVKALRTGSWIILDELNLAPSDVLEALNRLLDDNRELIIPETQEVIRPHPDFMLFATQNPPGSYAGRKHLSRAFRNRFLELHFGDVPQAELETILEQRCQIAPSYAKKIVQVFQELQHRRQTARIFENQHSFVTLRDLFRWGLRKAVGYQSLAEDGFMLIGERTRTVEDRETVKHVIESVLKVSLDLSHMYVQDGSVSSHSLVWTDGASRLRKLVAEAVKHGEPVLLVGSTGIGKTSICQHLAHDAGSLLRTVNCHLTIDASDILGTYRPARGSGISLSSLISQFRKIALSEGLQAPIDINSPTSLAIALDKTISSLPTTKASLLQTLVRLKDALRDMNALFTWRNGPLVEAMLHGDYFLLDEISLADDSVLERLNSVLEAGRQLTLAEKGEAAAADVVLKAHSGFRFLATMNPGGDFGKKELSPALRNRFTEIWVPPIEADGDLLAILQSRLVSTDKTISSRMIAFARAFGQQIMQTSEISLRDLLAWSEFDNACVAAPDTKLWHGACMAFRDRLDPSDLLTLRAVDGLLTSLVTHDHIPPTNLTFEITASHLIIGTFTMVRAANSPSTGFTYDTPTSKANLLRLVRAMQIDKPILLEGSPGIGKTSLVLQLAKLLGKHCARVNLSDQSDLSDLFGSLVPVSGGSLGHFAWQSAPFLKAMQDGDWVLLDETNLATQQVLEGLNSCLDHRGDVYITELGQTFTKHPAFRIFAAQNPLHQGGARKGLPKSFLNRFTQLQLAAYDAQDLQSIALARNSLHTTEQLRPIVASTMQLQQFANSRADFAQNGRPWDFNLRDLDRFMTLTPSASLRGRDLAVRCIYASRFRSDEDRLSARDVFISQGLQISDWKRFVNLFSSSALCAESTEIARQSLRSQTRYARASGTAAASTMSNLLVATRLSWPSLLYARDSSTAASIARTCSTLLGSKAIEFYASSQTDTSDLLGTFTQFNPAAARRDLYLQMVSRVLDLAANPTQYSSPASTIHSLHHALVHAIEDSKEWTGDFEASFTALSKDPEIVSMWKPYLKHLRRLAEHAISFVWQDGPLIHAMEAGHTFILHNANLCPSSVLDRLNPIFEPDGNLSLDEGLGENKQTRVVVPHPNFRMVMLASTGRGEISRAMRNRSLETYTECEVPRSQPFSLSSTIAIYDTELSHTILASNRLLSEYCAQIPPTNITARLQRSLGLPTYDVGKLAWLDAQRNDILSASMFSDLSGSVRAVLPLDPTVLLQPLSSDTTCSISDIVSTFINCERALSEMALAKGERKERQAARTLSVDLLAVCRDAVVEDAKHATLICSATECGLSVPEIALQISLLSTRYSAEDQFDAAAWASLVSLLVDGSPLPSRLRTNIARELEDIDLPAMRLFDSVWAAFLYKPLIKSWPLFDVTTSAMACLATMQSSSPSLHLLLDLLTSAVWRVEHVGEDFIQLLQKTVMLMPVQRVAPVTVLTAAVQNARLIARDLEMLHQTAQAASGITISADIATDSLPLGDAAHAFLALRAARTGLQGRQRLPTLSILLSYVASTSHDMPTSRIYTCLRDGLYTATRQVISMEVSLAEAPAALQCLRTVGTELVSVARSESWRMPESLSGILHALCKSLLFAIADAGRNPLIVQELEFISSSCCKKEVSVFDVADSAGRLSCLLWQLYRQKLIDPATGRLAVTRALEAKVVQTLDELSILHLLDGSLSSCRSDLLKQRLSLNREQLISAQTSPITRTFDARSMGQLQREIFSMQQHSYLDTGGILVADGQSLDRILTTLASFSRLLTRLYPNHLDLVAPLQLALSLRQISIECQQAHANSAGQSKAAFVTYPNCLALWADADVLADEDAILSSAAFLAHHSFTSAASAVNAAYRVILRRHQTWSRAETARAEDQDPSIYFRKELISDSQDDADVNSTADPQDILSRLGCGASKDHELLVDTFLQMHGVLNKLEPASNGKQQALPERIVPDSCSLIGSISALAKRSELLTAETPAEKVNFYRDPALAFVSETIRILDGLNAKVAALKHDWPEQMILEDLSIRIQNALDLRSDTPLIRILATLDRILPALDDWQSVASSTVSLDSFKSEVIAEIIRYRQLEIASWSTLLSDERSRFTTTANSWFHPLYSIFTQIEYDHNRIQSVFDVLTSFALDGPIGQFERRLALLAAFSKFAMSSHNRVLALMTESLHAFCSCATAQIEEQIKQIEQTAKSRVQEIRKIAAWKDVNVQALRESAAKNHHALLKCLRTYRAGLQASARPLLAFGPPSSVALTPLLLVGDIVLDGMGIVSSDKPHLANLKTTLSKAIAFNSTIFESGHLLSSAVSLRELWMEVAQTTKQLREFRLPVPESERKKATTALLTRKRRAWADLLRGLRRLGLSPNPSTTLLDAQSHISAFHQTEKPSNSRVSVPDPAYYMLLKSIDAVRASRTNVHEDISLSELLMAIGSYESLLARIVSMRSLLGNCNEMAERLCKLSERFNTLSGAALQGQTLYSTKTVHRVYEAVCKALLLLREADATLHRHYSLCNQRESPPDTEALLLTISNLQRNQVRLRECVEESAGSILLLPDEARAATEGSAALEMARECVHEMCGRSRDWTYLLAPIMSQLDVSHLLADERRSAFFADLQHTHESLIDSLLITIEDNYKTVAELPPRDDLEVVYDSLCRGDFTAVDKLLRSCIRNLQPATVLSKARDLEGALSAQVSDRSLYLSRIVPALAVYNTHARKLLTCATNWQTACIQLADTFGRLIIELASKGFCKPSQEDEEKRDNAQLDEDQQMDGTEATGFGEGVGSKDISDAVENQEQVEGMQDETAPDHEDDAATAGADAGVELEDDTAEPDLNNDEIAENSGDEGDDEQELEDRAENISQADRNQVDEKFWAADDGSEGDDDKQETSDRKANGPDTPTTELAAQESDNETADRDPAASNMPEQPDAIPEDFDEMARDDESKEADRPDSPSFTGAQDVPPLMDIDEEQEELSDASGEQVGSSDDMNLDEDHQEFEDGAIEDATEDLRRDHMESGDNANGDMPIEHSAEDSERAQQSLSESAPNENSGDPSQEASQQQDFDSANQKGLSAGTEVTHSDIPDQKPASDRNPTQSDIQLQDNLSQWQKRLDQILQSADEPTSVKTEIPEYAHAGEEDAEMAALGPSEEAQPAAAASDSHTEEERQDAMAPDQTEKTPQPSVIDPFAKSELDTYSYTATEQSRETLATMAPQEDTDADMGIGERPPGDVKGIVFNTADTNLSPFEAWKLYTARSAASSVSLTEQLRLILEPTKANRLQGDYRSGKRLNMKRIIPYIASDFTKDKVWLRRTKASDREYQIMVAIDDSTSMKDARLIELAFETLTLVVGAFNRLEVGEVAVVRFGADMQILQPFVHGHVNDESGGKMLEQFTFGQNITNYAALLRDSLLMFNDARLSSSSASAQSAELWQLQIIVSDGMTSDQENIRRFLRQAIQQKVFIVFIIVDSPTRSSSTGTITKQSILDIQTARYRPTASGAQEIFMQRYLDDFPFDAYVVVRDVAQLPEMLSRTLRQFFEMTARR